MKALAIGAHPDDVEIGCGATLALLKERGHKVYILALTRGEASGNPKMREGECKRAARILGAELFIANFKDTRITDGIETIKEIERIIKLVHPDIVFTHSQKDAHQDHRNTHFASVAAARKTKNILLYESPTALKEFQPQIFCDVTATADTKFRAMMEFASQASKTYLESSLHQTNNSKPKRVSSAMYGLMKYRGFQAGVAFAEAFEVCRYFIEV